MPHCTPCSPLPLHLARLPMAPQSCPPASSPPIWPHFPPQTIWSPSPLPLPRNWSHSSCPRSVPLVPNLVPLLLICIWQFMNPRETEIYSNNTYKPYRGDIFDIWGINLWTDIMTPLLRNVNFFHIEEYNFGLNRWQSHLHQNLALIYILRSKKYQWKYGAKFVNKHADM